jgi:hypothetical protein
VSFLCKPEASLRHHKPMGLHIGQVGQSRHRKTRYAWAVIFTKTRLVLSHGAVGCSGRVGFGALLVGENAISKIACMKIRGSQNSIGIVDLMCPRYAS